MNNSSPPIVVVGAGTAGCTVISYLASHTDRRILVVEPGPISHHDDESHFFDVLASGLVASTPDGYVQARALGGGSAVNGMLLTGEEPEHLHGLTRMATSDDIGPVGASLLADGGRYSRMWWNGGRWNPGRAVQHLVEEGRVMVLPRSVVEIIHRDGEVVGVDCNDEPLSASAVVLCAGAVMSPTILLRSGLAHVNSHIGMGLQNHPTVTARFSHPESSALFDTAVVREWSTSTGGQILNVAYERASAAEPFLGMLSVSLMNPRSRGQIGVDDAGEPDVNFHFLSEKSDLENLLMGVQDLLGLLRDGTYTSHMDSITLEGTPFQTLEKHDEESLRDWLLAHVQGVSHATSSCAGAVDDVGRIRGLENCWVADASVLPSVPTCTPAAPVTMEALRIARHIGESLS